MRCQSTRNLRFWRRCTQHTLQAYKLCLPRSSRKTWGDKIQPQRKLRVCNTPAPPTLGGTCDEPENLQKGPLPQFLLFCFSVSWISKFRMVYYFTSTVVDPPAYVYVGKDKFESA